MLHGSVITSRFGHTACAVDSSAVWGMELCIVFGGVSFSDGSSATDHHAALGDVLVLQTEALEWFCPQVVGPAQGLPPARAFHCAAVVGRLMYVFGGHVLSFDTESNKKRRQFFDDLWCLDTVSRSRLRPLLAKPLPRQDIFTGIWCHQWSCTEQAGLLLNNIFLGL